MIRKILIALLAMVSTGVILSGCGGEEPIVDQFTADIVQSAGGLATTGKFFVKAGNYRMELEESGQPLCVIVDQQTGITTISAPLEKMFTKIPVDHPASVMNDPFQGLKYSMTLGETRADGTETIEGYECDKSALFADDQKAMTQWFSRKLNFPIKIVMHGATEKMIELKNIQEVAVADSLFTLPVDYAEFQMPGQEPPTRPEWADGISSASFKNPPFEIELAAGDIVRVKPEVAKSLAVKAECVGEEECAVYAIPFKDDLPLRELSTYNNFARQGTICTRLHETSSEADEFVIRVDKGSARLSAKWQPMHERRLKAGEEFRVKLVPNLNIEDVRFVNLNDGESSCSWDYYSEGNLLENEVAGPAEYRSRVLRARNEAQRSVWSPIGDEIVIKADSGEVLVKLGQFDVFKF